MTTTRLNQRINAPRRSVYRAILDADAVRVWMVPDGMSSAIHAFDAREDGAFRISLTYDTPGPVGKTSARTDTYHGQFAKLVPDLQIVEVMEFETTDPAMQGQMRVTYTLADAGGGTDVLAVHENVPAGIVPADNELGWRMALAKLKALVEKDLPP